VDSWLLSALGGDTKAHIAEAAALLTVAIAAITGVAMYAGSYLTESLGQSIGNELRVRLYHHLQELSLAYYDTTRVGTLLSTLTGDVHTIQAFASSSTLTILTDTLSLAAMVVVMLWLRWDFALIALAVTRCWRRSCCASTRPCAPRPPAENGTHHQLLNLNGVYAELHHLQYGDAHR
jgi:ABC-type multidrug transport system fused ATPase/permease subunit